MKHLLIVAGLSLVSLSALAQNEADALQFSGLEYGGTARAISLGNAMGAIGGDVSSISTNPAGVGLFRSSEFTLSPSVVTSRTTSDYRDQSAEQRDAGFNISNVGYVKVYPFNRGKWRFGQFGFGYQRMRDFHADSRVNGSTVDNTFAQFLANRAGEVAGSELINTDPFFSDLAFQTFLIDPDPVGQGFVSAISDTTSVDQVYEFESKGRIAETAFSGSFNYDDRLYLGFGMTFQRVVREVSTSYFEYVRDQDDTDLDNYRLTQRNDTRGDGINFKAGFIYRLTDQVRVGGSYTSPTWYTLDRAFSTDIRTVFTDGQEYTYDAISSAYDYNLSTPARLTGSVGFVLGKRALISVNYEFVDYSAMQLDDTRLNPTDFSIENSEIARQYVSTGNVRAGAEYRAGAVSFRGGFGYQPSPFREGITESDATRMLYSGGIGYRTNDFSLDFAYRLTEFGSDFIAYSDASLAQFQHRASTLVATVGFRF